MTGPTRAEVIRRRLRSGSVITGAGLAVSAACQLIANLMLVATRSTAVFADFAVLTIAVLFAAMVTRAGIDRLVVPEIRAAHTAGGPDHGRRTGAALLSSAVFLAAVGALAVGSGLLGPVIDVTLTAPLTAGESWLVGAWLAAESLRFVVAEFHRAEDHFVRAAVAGYGIRAPLFLVLATVLVPVGQTGRTALLAAAAIASGVTLLVVVREVVATHHFWRVNPLPPLAQRIADHAWLLSSTLAAALIGGADVWVVGWLFGADETARYAFAVSMVGSLAMLHSALSGGLAPRLAGLLSRGEHSEAERVLVRPTQAVVLLTLAGYVFLLVVTEPVAVLLGGPDYTGITVLVAILGLSHVAGAVAGIAGWVLVFARRYASMSAVTIATAVVGIAVEVAVGYGLQDLVLLTVASALSTALIHIISALVVARTLSMRTDVLGLLARQRTQGSATT